MTDPDAPALPGVLAEIAEVAGLAAALKLAAHHGGQTVYIPGHARPDHWLVILLGQEAADAVCRRYRTGNQQAGARVLIPLARLHGQRAAMAKALAEGRSARQAAAVSGLHERTAYRMRARNRQDDRQPGLFDGAGPDSVRITPKG